MGDKYICLSCWRTFVNTFKQQGIQLEHFGTPCYEEKSVCPVCLSGAIVELSHCDKCGEQLDEDFYVTDENKYLCESCSPVIIKRVKGFYRMKHQSA